jgi:hypothetical protein
MVCFHRLTNKEHRLLFLAALPLLFFWLSNKKPRRLRRGPCVSFGNRSGAQASFLFVAVTANDVPGTGTHCTTDNSTFAPLAANRSTSTRSDSAANHSALLTAAPLVLCGRFVKGCRHQGYTHRQQKNKKCFFHKLSFLNLNNKTTLSYNINSFATVAFKDKPGSELWRWHIFYNNTREGF